MEIHASLLIVDIVTSVILIGMHLQELKARKKDDSSEIK
jgi:hypothetical protein